MYINWIAIILSVLLIGILIWIIVFQVKEHLLLDDEMLTRLKQVLDPIHPDIKSIKLYKGKKSYTLNKNKIFLCLKDKHGEYYSLNTLNFVLLHELAHFFNTKDVGHTKEFHRIFDDLLAKAKVLGIFNAEILIPPDYCT
jgi:hypothetical protein